MNIEQWLEQYGYWAVFFGTIIEGPLVLTLTGFLIHQEYLNVVGVFFSAFAATFILVEIFYFIGLVAGRYLLEKRPAWRKQHARFAALLERHKLLFILGFRFLCNMQIISSMVIGMSRIRPGHFSALNAAGAALWTIVFLGVGYFFGHAFEMLIEDIKRHEKTISFVLAAAVLIYYLARRLVWRRVAGNKQ